MAKAVVDVKIDDEEAAATADKQWTPRMIFEQLKEIDPNDLDDLQQLIYDHLWGPGGAFEQGREVKE